MSGTGRVVHVDAGTVPNTNEAARRVLVDRLTGERILFFVPIGDDPSEDRRSLGVRATLGGPATA